MPRSRNCTGPWRLLAGINRQNRFKGVAMAFCNEMAGRWRCERVSLGFLQGRYVQVTAMSHTEQFNRKMRLVQDIEAAMEECLDQDCEILYPSSQSSCINRAAGELSGNHGGKTLLSLPMRHEGRPCAAVTLERSAGGTFTSRGSGGHPTGLRPVHASADESAPVRSMVRGQGRRPGPPLAGDCRRAAVHMGQGGRSARLCIHPVRVLRQRLVSGEGPLCPGGGLAVQDRRSLRRLHQECRAGGGGLH